MSEMKNKPIYVVDKFYSEIIKEDFNDYDSNHKDRFDSTLQHLQMYNIFNNTVCDMGCGSGLLLKKLDKSNRIIGVDGAEIDIDDEVERYKFNFDYDSFGEKTGVTDVDHMMCFETFEHLSNPYNFIFECKKMMKENALFHISYPTKKIQHNTFYPSLLWGTGNFIQFMEQMAFFIKKEFVMPTRFGGVHFFVFTNKPWADVKMKWPKESKRLQGQPPHVQVNL